MKITKEIDFDLDIEELIEHYGITKGDSDDEIMDCIDDLLCGCDDEIYYTISADDVFKEYGKDIRKYLEKHEINLLEAFNDMVKEFNLEGRERLWGKAIPLIREKLK